MRLKIIIPSILFLASIAYAVTLWTSSDFDSDGELYAAIDPATLSYSKCNGFSGTADIYVYVPSQLSAYVNTILTLTNETRGTTDIDQWAGFISTDFSRTLSTRVNGVRRDDTSLFCTLTATEGGRQVRAEVYRFQPGSGLVEIPCDAID